VSCGADGRIALWEMHMSARARGVNAARVRIDPLTHEQATPSGAGAQGLRSADKAGMNQVAVRQDARLAATAGWDGTVRIFDLRKQRRLLAALTYHRYGVHRAKPFGGTTAADPWLLASGGADGRIALWRLYPPT
jgi:WD40 repeat protein